MHSFVIFALFVVSAPFISNHKEHEELQGRPCDDCRCQVISVPFAFSVMNAPFCIINLKEIEDHGDEHESLGE